MARVGLRVRSITPSMLVRAVLVFGALALVGWIIAYAWDVLLPFQVGAVLAYILLPLVHRLDRYLPRPVAILLVFGVGLIGFVLGLGYLLPIVATQFEGLLGIVPGPTQIARLFDRINEVVETLPPNAQAFVQNVVERAVTTVRANVFVYIQTVINVAITTVLSLLNTLGFVLGFVIVPFWLFYVLQDEQRGKDAVMHLLPASIRTDVVAVVKIIDRVFNNYLRGQLILGTMVGGSAFLGLQTLSLLGFEGIHSTVLLGIFAGITELIPTIGPFIGAIPAVIMGLFTSWETTIAIVVLYVLIQQVENAVLVPRVSGSTLSIHPAILMIALVALSQFGLLWAILAGPIVALARDLFRYVYGRFADPPRPAGELPPTKHEQDAAPARHTLASPVERDAAR
jgi:predicted PurR-regulated permease PerM